MKYTLVVREGSLDKFIARTTMIDHPLGLDDFAQEVCFHLNNFFLDGDFQAAYDMMFKSGVAHIVVQGNGTVLSHVRHHWHVDAITAQKTRVKFWLLNHIPDLLNRAMDLTPGLQFIFSHLSPVARPMELEYEDFL